MPRRSLPFLLLIVDLIAGPALAKVLAKSQGKSRSCWQKIETNWGKDRYLSRATNDGKIQKGTSCTTVGAAKVQR